MTKTTLSKLIVAGSLLSTSPLLFAGEYGDQCAMGLALEQHIDTDCSINAEISGKTYCFGNEDAKSLFLEDTKGNLTKASTYYNKSKS